MPNLRQLEYLVALADTCHFRRAAERANATQPTLSEQIRALEMRLGTQLVERTRGRVSLTPLGQQIAEIARRMLRDAGEIRCLAANGGREPSGLLRLGLPPTIGPYLLPLVAPHLRMTFPHLKLYVCEGIPRTLPQALENGIHDLIIAQMPVRSADIVSVTLFREPLYLIVASDHALAGRTTATLQEIEGQDVLVLSPGHQLHDNVVSICEDAGARLRTEFEGTSLDMLREMVVMGMGVTFMPAFYVRRELVNDPNVRILSISDRTLDRTIGMMWRRSSALQAAYSRFADFFRGAVTAIDDSEAAKM